jgi:hypothetical protein
MVLVREGNRGRDFIAWPEGEGLDFFRGPLLLCLLGRIRCRCSGAMTVRPSHFAPSIFARKMSKT